MTNTSNAKVFISVIYVGASAGSPVNNPNFNIAGWYQNAMMAPGASKQFTLSFAPLSAGPTTGYLQASVNSVITSVATLQGTATPGFSLTCSGAPQQCNGKVFNSSAPLDFGSVPSGTPFSVVFTLTNQTSGALSTLAVSLRTEQYFSSPFTLDISALPSTIAANEAASFTLTFEGTALVGQEELSATLVVGSNSYTVEGTPIGLAVEYEYQTIDVVPQNNSIDLGQVLSGAATLIFTVTNPIAAENAAMVSVSVSGAGFSLVGAPTTPYSIQPGQAMPAFDLIFSGSQPGSSYSGTLTIGTQVFALTATTSAAVGGSGSPLPGIALMCGSSRCAGQTFTSQQQVNVSVQLTSPAPSQSIFTLAMTFAPSITGISDDVSIQFIAPVSGRNLQMTMPTGSESATYNGSSQLTFQTGTTAGTITFTLTFLGQTTNLATITIPPAEVQLTSTLAQRQPPNLVVTLNGYDNTYGVGQLAFTFYDTSGKVIAPIKVNAASDFRQYFFGPNDTGGAFALQASFPVTGDVTQVGSVAVSLSNSSGTTTTTQTFQ